jgi:hypothetical protein
MTTGVSCPYESFFASLRMTPKTLRMTPKLLRMIPKAFKIKPSALDRYTDPYVILRRQSQRRILEAKPTKDLGGKADEGSWKQS